MNIGRIALWLIAALLPAISLAAPRAWLDRDSVRLGETVTLNLEVEGLNVPEPDFSVLDARFNRLGVSSRSQMSLVGGQRSANTLWAVALEPREAGVLSVPAIPVGGESTAPLSLTVLPAAVSSAGEDVFLEVEAVPRNPYVQQQVRYRIRLYYAVTLLDGQLEEPTVDGVELRRLGNDLSYQTQLGDRRYQVVERRFALLPEASGEIEIPPVRFRGRVLGGGRFGGSLSGGRQVSTLGEAIRLQVRPRPAGIAQDWLPAAQLEFGALGAAWPDRIDVGEPLALELRLAARGSDAARLPEFALPALAGAEVYPDQPSLRTGEDGDWLTGERRQRFAIVAQQPGELLIPELRLPWWNTETDRPEIATIPGRRIQVLPAAGRATSPPDDASGTASEWRAPVDGAGIWPWQLLSAALLLAWLATLGLWWRQRRTAPRPHFPQRTAPSTTQLRAALLRHDPQAFEAALLGFARASGLRVGTVGEVLERLQEAAQSQALADYLAARWRGGEIDWTALSRCFSQRPALQQGEESTAADTGVLPPLYPEHRAGAVR
jgi:hypothetical protein